MRDLNSHRVAAPLSPTMAEVSGFLSYKRGLAAESDWQLLLPAHQVSCY